MLAHGSSIQYGHRCFAENRKLSLGGTVNRVHLGLSGAAVVREQELLKICEIQDGAISKSSIDYKY